MITKNRIHLLPTMQEIDTTKGHKTLLQQVKVTARNLSNNAIDFETTNGINGSAILTAEAVKKLDSLDTSKDMLFIEV